MTGKCNTANRRLCTAAQWLIPALALYAVGSAAQDAAAQLTYEDKLERCNSCHGEAAPHIPDYPKLQGQYQSYLAYALRAYQAGRRHNPIMTQQLTVLSLSDEDIERLATYYAGQPGLVQIKK